MSGGGGSAGEAAVARGRADAGGGGGMAGLLTRARARARTAAFLLGALTAAALAPVHALPLLLTFAGLLHLVLHAPRPRDALVVGWWFGFGYFLAGLYWVGIAFFVEAERFGALAVPAVIGLCAVSAAFPAAACWLVARLRRGWRSVPAAALALALAWTGAEALREVATAFPWNTIGYVWLASPAVSQFAAVGGVYGLSLLTVAVAALPAALLERDGGRGRLVPPLLGAAALALIFAGGQARLALAGDVEPAPDVRLRLVQANVPQDRKWDPAERERWFRRHLELSAAPPPPGAPPVTHVVWPESAVPYALGRDPEARRLIGGVVPEGGYVLTGANRYDFDAEPLKVWNSLQVLDGEGAVAAHYDKVDLVPFGEFLPLRWLLGRLGLSGLAAGALDFQRGPGRITVALPGLPPFSALICYEAIFPGRAADRADRPDWLLNVTNDGWFGTSSGPFQHLAMARLRAVEEGLPLVRAANTGVSAVIDPYGRVVARLGLNAIGALDADLPRPLDPTPYARLGPLGPLALAALAALLAAAAERRARRWRP